ncbi:MAG: methyl-accepting chemotaxis protein [Desulfovibrionales bacterium]|nr:methyl-accepting chemotaxis protein [Desulfovibrionales bacterium]
MKNMKLVLKMSLGFGVLTFITLIIGLTGIGGLRGLQGNIEAIGDKTLPAVEHLLRVKSTIGDTISTLRMLASAELSAEDRKNLVLQIQELRAAYRQSADMYAQLPLTTDEAALWQEFQTTLSSTAAVSNQVLELNERFLQLDIMQPEELAAKLQLFHGDHYALVTKVGKMLLTGESFDGGTDATKCNYGQWSKTFSTSNAQLQSSIKAIVQSHQLFHHTISEIKELVAAGRMDEGQARYKNLEPVVDMVFAHFQAMQDQANRAQEEIQNMNKLLMVESREGQDKLNLLLGRMVDLATQISSQVVTDTQTAASKDITIATLGLGIAILIALALGFFLTRAITIPVFKGVDFAKKIATGDLTATVDVHQKDELGILAQALRDMVARLREVVTEVQASANNVAAGSTELATIATQMTGASTQTATMAGTVSTATGEMTDNMHSVSAAMEEASVNINTVAAAAEQMSATIHEIAQNSERAKNTTASAVLKAQGASVRVGELGQAAQEISAVTATITAISSQTNLLALNATIEAARAGEAGRGFAVVANEIKELAQQTTKAAEDIRAKIDSIQSATAQTVEEITEISHVIGDMNDIVTTVAAAVEEQSVTTREIAQNVGQASAGISEINTNVAASSSMTQNISADIALVRQASEEMTMSSQTVHQSSTELSSLAERLRELMARFTI